MEHNPLNEALQLLSDYRNFVDKLREILYRNAADEHEALQLLRDYRDFVDELQHILYQNAADDEDLDIKVAELRRAVGRLLGEPVEQDGQDSKQ